MDSVSVIIKGRAIPGRREDVLTTFREHLAQRALDNTAQECVVWSADESDSDVFHLFEVYSDRAVLAANSSAPWFGAYLAAVAPLLAGQPEFTTAVPRWRKPAPA